MSGPRPSFASTLTMSLVAAGTTWAALTAWRGFVTEPNSYLNRLAAVALLVALLGALLRWRNTPRWLTLLAQAVAVTALVTYQVTGSALFFLAPGLEVGDALRVAVDAARTYAAPISSQAGPVWPLLVVGGAVFFVLVDTVACTFRRVPGAGLALLAIYSVPSGLLDGGPGWGSFVIAATGFLALLHFDAREQVQRWGRTVGPDDDSPWGHGNPVREAARAGAGRIGITATALALIVPTFVPALGVNLFDFGAGSGNGDIKIRKPIADMRLDLERGRDVPLVRITTNDPNPEYLRIAVLNRFTGQEWSNGDRDVDRDDTASGALPPPAGLAGAVPRAEYDYDLDITDQFNSTWLPTQFPASAVEAKGDWRFDPNSMDFLAADDDLDTRGLSYSLTSVKPDYGTDGRFFLNARTGDVSDEVLELPNGVPGIARDLARSVTAPGINDYERALLLQRWFRRDGGFIYDLKAAPNGTGNGTFETFLSERGRVGYCEQFASAMAVMARVLGIPARVAVGFLQPDPLGDGRWEYTSDSLHAWPELYFSGAGWVRFEPTPSGRVEDVPDYSRVPVNGIGEEPSSTTSSGTQSGGTATVAPNPRPTGPVAEPQGTTDDENGGRSTGQRLLVIGGTTLLVLLVVGALLLGPRSLRQQSRRSRLGGDPDEVWAEVRATSLDLGVPWPDGRSPREVGTVLVDHLGNPEGPVEERPRTGPEAAPEAAEALERLVVRIEEARYARPGAVATLTRSTLDADAAAVVASLTAGVTPRARRQAQWLPRSVWKRRA